MSRKPIFGAVENFEPPNLSMGSDSFGQDETILGDEGTDGAAAGVGAPSKGTRSIRCGSKKHETSSYSFDLTRTKCFKYNSYGHVSMNCEVKQKATKIHHVSKGLEPKACAKGLSQKATDLLRAGGELMDQTMKKVQERFTFGSTKEGSFRFYGRKIESNEEEFRVSSPETLDKVKLIYIEKARIRQQESRPRPKNKDKCVQSLAASGGSLDYADPS